MGLFSRGERVPEIPFAPNLPEIPAQEVPQQQQKDLPELPSFPANSQNENFNQEMVKSAVSDLPSPEEKEAHVEVPQTLHVEEGAKEGSMIPPKPSVMDSTPEPHRQVSHEQNYVENKPSIVDSPKRSFETNPVTRPPVKSAEPIFVRIDKFQVAQRGIKEVKSKIGEIELVLRKIKDVKLQEEAELNGWTEDIEKIKSRLAEIDTGFFSKI